MTSCLPCTGNSPVNCVLLVTEMLCFYYNKHLSRDCFMIKNYNQLGLGRVSDNSPSIFIVLVQDKSVIRPFNVSLTQHKMTLATFPAFWWHYQKFHTAFICYSICLSSCNFLFLWLADLGELRTLYTGQLNTEVSFFVKSSVYVFSPCYNWGNICHYYLPHTCSWGLPPLLLSPR